MNNKTNVGLIYTHPKGDRGTDDLDERYYRQSVVILRLLDNHRWPIDSGPFVVSSRSDQHDKPEL